jgi:hypothetical protein
MRQTSVEAYNTIKKIGKRQKEVLWYIRNFPDSTDRELTRIMRYGDPNKVRPRRKELEDMELIKASGSRICTVSGKRALTWRVVTNE